MIKTQNTGTKTQIKHKLKKNTETKTFVLSGVCVFGLYL